MKKIVNKQCSLKKINSKIIKMTLFDRRGRVSRKNLYIKDIYDNIENIKKHKLIVFDTEKIQKRKLVDFLYTKDQKGILAEYEGAELYYFPDLNYQDIYLVKYLLKLKNKNDTNINIIMGNNII